MKGKSVIIDGVDVCLTRDRDEWFAVAEAAREIVIPSSTYDFETFCKGYDKERYETASRKYHAAADKRALLAELKIAEACMCLNGIFYPDVIDPNRNMCEIHDGDSWAFKLKKYRS